MATLCVSVRSLLRPKYLDFIRGHSLRWAATDDGTKPAQNADIPDEVAKKRAKEWAEAKPFESIPSLRILPFVGTNWLVLPIIGKFKPLDMYGANLYKHRMLGDIFRDKFGSTIMVSITNPNELMKAFQRSDKFPVRGVLKALETYRKSREDMYSTKGLLVTDDNEWWTLRQQVQHLMDPTNFDPYLDPLQDVAYDLVQKIENERDRAGDVPDFMDELYKWALESVGVVALDARLGCLRPNLSPDSESMKMINVVRTMFKCMNKLEAGTGSIGIWKYLPSPAWRKFVKVSNQFSEIAFKHIDKAYKELNTTAGSMTGGKLTTLQTMLLNKKMGLGNVKVTVADMLMAGIETTAHTAGFFLYNIARFPEQQEILYQEIKKRYPGRTDRLTECKFAYLSCCFNESLRLLPTVAGLTRVMKEDIVLCGYRVPKGSLIVSNNHIMGMDERLFSNAKEFMPERWMVKDKPHPATQLHFGFGRRACIGRQLAELEVFCLITMILRFFKVEYHYEEIGVATRLINAPDKPLRLTFIKREDAE